MTRLQPVTAFWDAIVYLIASMIAAAGTGVFAYGMCRLVGL
jgi:hypothetical protein